MIQPLTSAGNLTTLISQLNTAAINGQAPAILASLHQVASCLQSLGRADLGQRLINVATKLDARDVMPASVSSLPALHELSILQTALDAGQSLDEALALKGRGEELKQLQRGRRRAAPQPLALETLPSGGFPAVAWETYGSDAHHAPLAPGHTHFTHHPSTWFAFAVMYIGGKEEESDHAVARERFFDITAETRRKIRESRFIPPSPRAFPTEVVRKMIDRAAGFEPRYGDLLHDLVIMTAFEAFGWEWVEVTDKTPWTIDLLFHLRLHVVNQLLRPETRDDVLKDAALMKVVKGTVPLEGPKANWHHGKRRRDVLVPWLLAIYGQDKFNFSARWFGAKIARANMMRPPPHNASIAAKRQWLFRYWLTHHEFGALHPSIIPQLPAQVLSSIAFLPNAHLIDDRIWDILRTAMGDFYSADEYKTLMVKR